MALGGIETMVSRIIETTVSWVTIGSEGVVLLLEHEQNATMDKKMTGARGLIFIKVILRNLSRKNCCLFYYIIN